MLFTDDRKLAKLVKWLKQHFRLPFLSTLTVKRRGPQSWRGGSWGGGSIRARWPHSRRRRPSCSLGWEGNTCRGSRLHWYRTRSQTGSYLTVNEKKTYIYTYMTAAIQIFMCGTQSARVTKLFTRSSVAPKAKQKTIGPARSVSFMMLPSATFSGWSTVRVFCQMWSKLIPNSETEESHIGSLDELETTTILSF